MNPMLFIDFYKSGHMAQYPQKTEMVYSNFTPRTSRVKGVDNVVFFGLQYFIKEYLIDSFNKNFFEKDIEVIIEEYKRLLNNSLGANDEYKHIRELHELGYLPIAIDSLPEGSEVPISVPVLVMYNTDKRFAWITNYLETLISCVLWKPITSATTAFQYRKRFDEYAEKTGYSKEFVQWQGHDFSFRGMSGLEDASMSSAGHLLSFTGTDTLPAISFMEKYYNADCGKELIGGSVPATEHSVMCMGQQDSEIETFRRLIEDVYPNGIVSIVSDTWDFWKVMTEYLPELKDKILARDGRVVIRPDSGEPVDIICGTGVGGSSPESIGAYELLWNVFGGHINDEGYKVLNDKVGLIYGDSITLERQKLILERLEGKGFCASNLVLGIGSFTYEYVTRDTFGFAMKATYGVVDGKGQAIFKDPKTDSGMKKSAKGLLEVHKIDGKYTLRDNCEKVGDNELKPIFRDGCLIVDYNLSEIRERLLGK